MMNRPGSITVISFILVAWSLVGLLAAIVLMTDPEAWQVVRGRPVPILLLFAAPPVMFTAGIAIFQGRNWGRLLYLGWGLLNFGLSLLWTRFTTAEVVPLAIFLVLLFFLFRPEANAHFNSGAAVKE